MNFKSKYLSNNSKIGASLDVSRQDANCLNSCHAAAYCYINDNIQDKINPGYNAKMKRNFKLISGPNFGSATKFEPLMLDRPRELVCRRYFRPVCPSEFVFSAKFV